MKKSAKKLVISELVLYTYCDDFTLYNFLSLIISIQIAIMVIFIKLYCGNPEIRKFSQRANCTVFTSFPNCTKKFLTKILGLEKMIVEATYFYKTLYTSTASINV